MENDRNKMEAPKPLSCKINGTVKHTIFNLSEIRGFVGNTTAEIIEVETDDGKKSVLFVDWIRRILNG